MSDISLEDIASLCKRRGFIYQGSEIYGGLAGTWDYGPLGVQLKRNISNLWWKMFVEDRDDMYGIDAAILMNQKVWQASGHVQTFTDPLIECSNCHSRFRVDKTLDIKAFTENLPKMQTQWIEALKNPISVDGTTPPKEQVDKLKDYVDAAKRFSGPLVAVYMNQIAKVKCPVCGQIKWGEPRQFNMMFKTTIGPVNLDPQISFKGDTTFIKDHNYTYTVEGGDVQAASNDEIATNTVFLRPETAQGIFTNYKNVVDSLYPDLPFGLAQQGKAFRNEISPRDFVFRAREFEQMEIEYFVDPQKWEEAFEMWRERVHQWLEALGLPQESVHELEVPADDLAHYSRRTIDFEFDYPHGRDEILGLAYRTNFDLQNIQSASGKSMEYRPKDGSKPFVPHVIEPSFGVERAVMAVLVSSYREDEIKGEKRTVLKLPKHLAPVRAAVSPLLKNKPELIAKAREVYAMLHKEFGAVMWDDNGNIGKRYRRQDEIGTPSCVTIDFQTLEDNTVTVRDRDTAEQTRVAIADLIECLN
ncbi:MAG TPA: glycine--tRNA ligase [Candidatus Saccharimonadales bacterium]|nr:glycine--tRNA ligase [Candidatus Saccharimonadales bacterium]